MFIDLADPGARFYSNNRWLPNLRGWGAQGLISHSRFMCFVSLLCVIFISGPRLKERAMFRMCWSGDDLAGGERMRGRKKMAVCEPHANEWTSRLGRPGSHSFWAEVAVSRVLIFHWPMRVARPNLTWLEWRGTILLRERKLTGENNALNRLELWKNRPYTPD